MGRLVSKLGGFIDGVFGREGIMRAVSEASTRTIIGSPEGGQAISSAKQRNRPGDHNWLVNIT
jgi:hypothetical protein